MNNWSEVLLKDICDITRGASPRPIHDFMTEDLDGIPWVKIRDATASNTRFIENTKEFIKKEGKNKSVSVISGDLIVSNSATPGLPKIMGIDACIHDGWLLLRNLNGVCKEFLFYLLINDRKQIVSQGTGTVFTNLKTDILKNHQIKLPPISEQEEIASFLGSVDDKIELNQKMNEILEEIAKTLFKSWFIDFDPVRAKAEGRPTGLSKEISDLFPDSFEDSGLGEIPSGWRVGCLQNIIECFDSKRIPLSKKSRQERVGIYPYYGATSIIDYVDDYLFDDELVLIGEDGSVERDDGTPFVQFINEKCWVNNHAHVLKAKDQFSNFYIYIFLNQVKIGPYVTGAVQKKINQTNLFSIPVIIPDEKILKAFNSITDPLKDKIFLNPKESDVLSSIRDTLLPKLISGELKISDAENFIHGAGV